MMGKNASLTQTHAIHAHDINALQTWILLINKPQPHPSFPNQMVMHLSLHRISESLGKKDVVCHTSLRL